MLQTLSISLLPILVIIAAMIDVTYYKIPNWLTGLTAALFFPMAIWAGMPLNEFGWHVLAGVVLFFLGYAFFSFGFFGGGDAKMMAAAGLWFGASNSVEFIVFTAIVGGVLAVAMAAWRYGTMYWEVFGSKRLGVVNQQLKRINPKLPYGFALCVGAILAFPNTWWMTVG